MRVTVLGPVVVSLTLLARVRIAEHAAFLGSCIGPSSAFALVALRSLHVLPAIVVSQLTGSLAF